MARPRLKPTPSQRRQVEIAAGSGLAHDEIATALDLSRSSLERHFANELTAGACKRRVRVIEAMYRAAMRGSASAQKAYLAMPLEPTPAIGKKAAAQRAARTAQVGTPWEALLPKSRSVN